MRGSAMMTRKKYASVLPGTSALSIDFKET